MKLKDIDDQNIKFTDLENTFNVYEDERFDDKRYFLNLNSGVYFNGAPVQTYNVKSNMFWTQLSYNIYNTTRLWWLLMKVNDVDGDNLFDVVEAGSQIKILDREYVSQVCEQMI